MPGILDDTQTLSGSAQPGKGWGGQAGLGGPGQIGSRRGLAGVEEGSGPRAGRGQGCTAGLSGAGKGALTVWGWPAVPSGTGGPRRPQRAGTVPLNPIFHLPALGWGRRAGVRRRPALQGLTFSKHGLLLPFIRPSACSPGAGVEGFEAVMEPCTPDCVVCAQPCVATRRSE